MIYPCLLLRVFWLLTVVPAPAAVVIDPTRFFADEPADICGRRLTFGPGIGADDDRPPVSDERVNARASFDRAVRLWWPGGRGPFLEIGPGPRAAIAPNLDRVTVFWDLDINALAAVERWGSRKPTQVHPLYVDFNDLTPAYRAAFTAKNREVLRRFNPDRPSFRAVALSEVLNYVDHRALLAWIKTFQGPGDLIFVGNRLDFGDRALFHPGRPRARGDIESALTELGYRIEHRLPKAPLVASDEQMTWVARLR